MGKILIYTALFGSKEELREPLKPIPDAEFLCFTDRHDLKSDTWRIIHERDIPNFFVYKDRVTGEAYRYHKPRIKARMIKTILPVRIMGFTDFFDSFDGQVYIWVDGSMQLKQDPSLLIKEFMKDADMLSFQHPDRFQIEEEAHAAHLYRGTNLEKALMQVTAYRARGFTRAEQKAISATGFLFRKHTIEMNNFNLAWISEILIHTERDQLSVDYCIWKHRLKINYIPSARSYRRNPWVQFYPHRKELGNA